MAYDDSYPTDAPYVWHFNPDTSPLRLNYVARLSSVAPVRLDEGFSYLELGCGNGLVTNTLAAGYPEGRFHAVDLNPEHIANARRIAELGNLDNATFHEATFAAFLAENPSLRFDFVVLHGVYSWVSSEERAEIRAILASMLAPGGLAYVSYNALPGTAALMPLREILQVYTANREGSSLDKAREGLRYLIHLKEQKAGFLQQNRAARDRVDQLLAHDLRYVVHEYFTPHWRPFYFRTVAEELAESDLRFVGSLPSVRNILELSVPEGLRPTLKTAPDRLVYETHKSFVLNETFRCDLYVKEPAMPAGGDLLDVWSDVLFGPVVATPGRLPLELETPIGRFTPSGPAYELLAERLAREVLDFAEVCEAVAPLGLGAAEASNCLHVFCASGRVAAMRTRAARPGGEGRRFRLASAFNRALLQERALLDQRCFLASEVAGNGIELEAVDALAVLALDQSGAGDDSTDWALDFLAEHDRTLALGTSPIASDPDRRKALEDHFRGFWNGGLQDLLVRLGVLLPVRS